MCWNNPIKSYQDTFLRAGALETSESSARFYSCPSLESDASPARSGIVRYRVRWEVDFCAKADHCI